jgi:hypothetical protein
MLIWLERTTEGKYCAARHRQNETPDGHNYSQNYRKRLHISTTESRYDNRPEIELLLCSVVANHIDGLKNRNEVKGRTFDGGVKNS